jgi:hypothetical protein
VEVGGQTFGWGITLPPADAAGLRLRSSGQASDLIRACDLALDRNARLRQAVDRCCVALRGSPASLPAAVRSDHH